MKSWATAKIPHLIVTDFDSLTKETDRAILTGVKAAGYTLTGESSFHSRIDAVLDKDEASFSSVSVEATNFFAAAGVNVFVFTSDLEYSLVTSKNQSLAAAVLTSVATNGVNYSSGYSLESIRKQIGSKGVPINGISSSPYKKPYIHEKIADTIDLDKAHPDITRLLDAIEALGKPSE
jgi:hypothetical protein